MMTVALTAVIYTGTVEAAEVRRSREVAWWITPCTTVC